MRKKIISRDVLVFKAVGYPLIFLSDCHRFFLHCGELYHTERIQYSSQRMVHRKLCNYFPKSYGDYPGIRSDHFCDHGGYCAQRVPEYYGRICAAEKGFRMEKQAVLLLLFYDSVQRRPHALVHHVRKIPSPEGQHLGHDTAGNCFCMEYSSG